MSKYEKELDEGQQRYNKSIKNGVSIYEGVDPSQNILQMDKYVFKNSDLMGEIPQKDFPYKLKKDTCFSILSVKGENANIIVEKEGDRTYFCWYYMPKFHFFFVVSFNEKENETITNATFDKALVESFKKSKVSKEQLLDMAVNNLSKMISILDNEDYHLKHPTLQDVRVRTKTSMKNVGKPFLVTTRHKNMMHVCDAFPFFYEIDFKKMLEDKNAE